MTPTKKTELIFSNRANNPANGYNRWPEFRGDVYRLDKLIEDVPGGRIIVDYYRYLIRTLFVIAMGLIISS
jgi:hypothetical protein